MENESESSPATIKEVAKPKRKWFVTPDTVRIDLGDGDWIDIKKRLNIGEEKVLTTAGFGGVTMRTPGDEEEDKEKGTDIDVNWKAMSVARVNAYLVAWNLADEEGVTVEISPQAIDSLDPVYFDFIDNKIVGHIEAQDKEKKRLIGELEPEKKSSG